MSKTRMPSARKVASYLVQYKKTIGPEYQDEEGNIGIDIRLQVYDGWQLHSGDSSYDTNHNGFWGCGFLTPTTNCLELAKDLIDQAADHAAQCGELA